MIVTAGSQIECSELQARDRHRGGGPSATRWSAADRQLQWYPSSGQARLARPPPATAPPSSAASAQNRCAPGRSAGSPARPSAKAW